MKLCLLRVEGGEDQVMTQDVLNLTSLSESIAADSSWPHRCPEKRVRMHIATSASHVQHWDAGRVFFLTFKGKFPKVFVLSLDRPRPQGELVKDIRLGESIKTERLWECSESWEYLHILLLLPFMPQISKNKRIPT